MIIKDRELNMWIKRELNMQIRFYLNGNLYYQTFKGYCYVVDFYTGKTTRISFAHFDHMHSKKYDY